MRRRYTTFTLLILDVACAIGVFNLAFLARGFGLPDGLLLKPLLAPIAIILFAIYLIDGYNPRTDMLGVDYASQHAIAFLGALAGTLLLTFALVSAPYALQGSRLVLSLSFAGIAALTLASRRAIHLRRVASRGRRSLVYVGDPQSSAVFREEYARMPMHQTVLFAALTPPGPATPDGSVEAPLGFDALLDEIESGRIAAEAIVLRESARDLAPGMSRRLVQLYFSGVPTYTLELFHQVYWRKIPTYRINPTWLFQEGFKVAREPVFERLKRASDIVLAGGGLILGAPLIALGALAVWLEDRGPVFFVQPRVGKNHVKFRLLKLRSMRLGPPGGDPYTRPGDPRITRVGGFLRTSRLDELPQLWNVLRGDMSLIGPRAEWDRLVESYERDIPCYHFRHLVKPGITGWAQVNYPYGASRDDTIRKLEYDLYYIRHFSFTLDAAIVLKTIHLMLFGRGR